jgi:hypothetical protein
MRKKNGSNAWWYNNGQLQFGIVKASMSNDCEKSKKD